MEENNEIKTQETDRKIFTKLKELAKAAKELTKVRLAYNRAMIKENGEQTKEKLKTEISNGLKKAKISLEDNSRKYDEVRNEVRKIKARHNLSIETLQAAYNITSKEANLQLAELYGQKDETLASCYESRNKVKEYNEINNVELDNELAPIEAEHFMYKQQAFDALENEDYAQVREILRKCEELKLKSYKTEEKYKNKPNPYRAEYKENVQKLAECKKKIKEAEEFAKEIEENFKDACKESLENKEQALAKVENNKMFDKIKGFLSKSVLSNINKTKKFKENTLKPLKNNVENFAKSVPEKAENIKEKSKSKFKSIFEKGKEQVINAKDKVVEKAYDTRDFVNDKVQDVKDAGTYAKDFASGKLAQAKEFVVEKAGDVRDFADAKIQDAYEGISQAKDYLSGKAYQAVDTAYNYGVDTVAKGRESAISGIERKIEECNKRVRELREKNRKLEEKRNKRNNEKGLF